MGWTVTANRFFPVVLFGGLIVSMISACSQGAPGAANPASPSATVAGPGGTSGGGTTPTPNNGSSGSTGGSTGSGGSTDVAGAGRLTVRLTDSPFSEAEAVLVTFTDFSVHRTGGEWETIQFPGGGSRTCDLKQLEAGAQALLAEMGTLEAGKYTQIRLNVARASIHFDNAATSGPCAPTIAEPAGLKGTVTVPSGEVKLNHNFTITAGGTTTILLDFDGDASIKQTAKGKTGTTGSAGTFTMKPVISILKTE